LFRRPLPGKYNKRQTFRHISVTMFERAEGLFAEM
jgi:hypothetical protein